MPQLFSLYPDLTVLENLRYARPHATSAEIEAAAVAGEARAAVAPSPA